MTMHRNPVVQKWGAVRRTLPVCWQRANKMQQVVADDEPSTGCSCIRVAGRKAGDGCQSLGLPLMLLIKGGQKLRPSLLCMTQTHSRSSCFRLSQT